MGRKHVVPAYQVITGGDMSGAIESEVTDCEQMDHVSYMGSWSGTAPIGTFTVEISNDKISWLALPFGQTLAVNVDSDSFKFDVELVNFKYIKLKYAPTSGVGTLQAFYKATTKGA